MLIIFLSFAVVREAGFPGAVAILPVVGAFLTVRSASSQQGVEKLLSHPALVGIGRMSYALYLWHWPIFCFVDYQFFDRSGWLRVGLKVALTLLITPAFYLALEIPWRRAWSRPEKSRSVFACFSVLVVILAMSGFAIRWHNYAHLDTRLPRVATGGVSIGKSDAARSVVLMGDSNAGMYGKAFVELSEQLGFRLNAICVPALNPFPESELWKQSIAYLKKSPPDVVVFVSCWARRPKETEDHLSTVVTELLSHSRHVILIAGPPILPKNGLRSAIRESGVTSVFEDATDRENREKCNAILSRLNSPRVTVIAVEDLFFGDGEGVRYKDERGRQLFWDRTHLSYFGASLVKARILPALQSLIAD